MKHSKRSHASPITAFSLAAAALVAATTIDAATNTAEAGFSVARPSPVRIVPRIASRSASAGSAQSSNSAIIRSQAYSDRLVQWMIISSLLNNSRSANGQEETKTLAEAVAELPSDSPKLKDLRYCLGLAGISASPDTDYAKLELSSDEADKAGQCMKDRINTRDYTIFLARYLDPNHKTDDDFRAEFQAMHQDPDLQKLNPVFADHEDAYIRARKDSVQRHYFDEGANVYGMDQFLRDYKDASFLIRMKQAGIALVGLAFVMAGFMLRRHIRIRRTPIGPRSFPR